MLGADMDGQTVFAALASVTMLAYMLVVLNRHLAERRRDRQARERRVAPPPPAPRDPQRPWG
ncbi:hypothetical protein [Brevundimonas balnearis]|uniref:Heme exporter protein D n=1 Tax=Brevundimonas balnearis TaxID=1572858 RepID=A0ABV6QZ72_9CAUL